ncbi:MAG: CRTAC1 family protein [Acidobacteria bacterium]|nr:CRTAC1 family protein [Acidobacteriota bacterium]
MRAIRYLAVFVPLAILACTGNGGDEAARDNPVDSTSPPAGAIVFAEVAAQAGLDFHHFNDRRNALLPEDNGSGLAFGDYDNDGFDDLFVPNLAGSVLLSREELAQRTGGKLFRNLADGTFEDVTTTAGLEHVGWHNGAVWADVDGDGWLDLLITGLDEIVLFRNLGDGSFENASVGAGLGRVDCIANGPALADFDRDGDLDLYVPCYVDFPWDRVPERPEVGGRPATMTTPADYPPQQDLFFENDGGGRFTEIAERSGLADSTGRGLQAVFADFDDDGWPDLYVSNDQSFDRLYRNQGDGTFEEVSIEAGTRDPRAGMGAAVADYDRDGRLDLFLTHWVGEDNALYRNLSEDGLLLFADTTIEHRLAPIDPALVGWGTGFFDFELDGDDDLLVVNGSTVEDEWTLEVLRDPKMIPQKMLLYQNVNGRFEDVSSTAGAAFGAPIVGRGASFADYDRDGLIDVAVLVHNGPILLLANRSPVQGHWLEIELVGEAPNRWAVGAKVTVESGGQSQIRQLLVGESWAGSNSPVLHFGLGGASEASRIEVRWPGGGVTETGPVGADRRIRLWKDRSGWTEVPAAPRPSRPWGEDQPTEETQR